MELLFMGRHVIRLDSVESTNNFAATILQTKIPEGAVIVAREQTAGRGQRGNSWNSEPGKNLTLTYILRPGFLPLGNQNLLNKAIALAVARTAELIVPASFVRIKWPNDIFLENRKLAGILVETAVKGSQIVSCLAGIGLNVNQTTFQVSAGNPVSLAMELGRELELDGVMNQLSKYLEVYYLKLRSGQGKNIIDEYNYILWKRGQLHTFQKNGKDIQARIEHVDEQGRLVLLLENGVEEAYVHGSIQWF